MRRLTDWLFRVVVYVHVFINKDRVKAAGSLLYVIGAIIVTLARTQLRTFGRVMLQSSYVAQLKMLLVSGMSNLGVIIQQAETMFR